MTQVLTDPIEDRWSHLDLADERVATPAQESANAAGVVTMIDHKSAVGRVTEQTSTLLRLGHDLDLLGGEVVLPHQAGAQVLRSGRLGIRPSPLSEALVPPGLVGLSVAAAALVRARLAVGAEVLSRLREGLKRQILTAVRASLHALSMTCQRGNVARFDQPCHADVLLEIANSEPA